MDPNGDLQFEKLYRSKGTLIKTRNLPYNIKKNKLQRLTFSPEIRNPNSRLLEESMGPMSTIDEDDSLKPHNVSKFMIPPPSPLFTFDEDDNKYRLEIKKQKVNKLDKLISKLDARVKEIDDLPPVFCSADFRQRINRLGM
ncbi:unnamed protein product [Moneuplotes crassus]|uniref:Uncharacterized protein n=1 Tax=Euplotes crassus TaxID=5936 RepID=A0AAD1XP00_EUPCR|nr:unnamed protein product [Moneuplotes crassus]